MQHLVWESDKNQWQAIKMNVPRVWKPTRWQRRTINCAHSTLLRTDNNPSFFSRLDIPSGPRPPLWGSSITPRHTHTHIHSTSLLWTRDRPVAENCTWRHTTPTEDRHHDSGGIRTQDSSKWAATGPSKRAATGIGGKKIYGHVIWKFGLPWFSSLSVHDCTESAALDLT